MSETRRDFLRKFLTTGAGLVVAPQLLVPYEPKTIYTFGRNLPLHSIWAEQLGETLEEFDMLYESRMWMAAKFDLNMEFVSPTREGWIRVDA